MTLKGVALVTGSSQGIGKAIALKLAQDGYDLALNDLRSKTEQLANVQEAILALGRRSTIVVADVALEEEVIGMINATVETLGSLDVMVANGAVFLPGSLLEMSTEDWDRTFAVNCRGTWLCYKYAALQMVKQGRGGRIIGASSGAGKQGIAMMAAYSSTKFGIRGLTQVAAQELGPHRITVNAYAPGPVDTELFRTTAAGVSNNPEAVVESARVQCALGYLGRPEDIASFVSYLATPDAHYITGQTVSINGGWYYD
ncbi:NAD-binding protein [Mycena rebaudengoi]|nr:NAD-binding protein [Mycena rebaudengoi]